MKWVIGYGGNEGTMNVNYDSLLAVTASKLALMALKKRQNETQF